MAVTIHDLSKGDAILLSTCHACFIDLDWQGGTGKARGVNVKLLTFVRHKGISGRVALPDHLQGALSLRLAHFLAGSWQITSKDSQVIIPNDLACAQKAVPDM